jgi:hypothetical protein
MRPNAARPRGLTERERESRNYFRALEALRSAATIRRRLPQNLFNPLRLCTRTYVRCIFGAKSWKNRWKSHQVSRRRTAADTCVAITPGSVRVRCRNTVNHSSLPFPVCAWVQSEKDTYLNGIGSLGRGRNTLLCIRGWLRIRCWNYLCGRMGGLPVRGRSRAQGRCCVHTEAMSAARDRLGLDRLAPVIWVRDQSAG